MVSSIQHKELLADITGGLFKIYTLDGDSHQLKNPYDPSASRQVVNEAYVLSLESRKEGLRQLVNEHDAGVVESQQLVKGLPPSAIELRREAATELGAELANLAFRNSVSTAFVFSPNDSGNLVVGLQDGKVANKDQALQTMKEAILREARRAGIDEPNERNAIGQYWRQTLRNVELPSLPNH